MALQEPPRSATVLLAACIGFIRLFSHHIYLLNAVVVENCLFYFSRSCSSEAACIAHKLPCSL